MKNVVKNDDTTKDNLLVTPFDESLQELTKEAAELFKTLDSISRDIHKLESQLTDIKAHFPFRLLVNSSKSNGKLPKESHVQSYPNAASYSIKTCWYLSWEEEEGAKKFRLFLISEESEEVWFRPPGWDPDAGIEEIFFTEKKFKKAFSEMPIGIRLQYAEYLIPFMDGLKSTFKRYRNAIAHGEIPF